tara:strand:+ start:790 stop:2373 length:1584 start_codon:yes stop_codon:yes gene_type:complete
MKLPKELGTLNDLKRREAKAFEATMYWHSLLDDVYEQFLPNRNLFDNNRQGQNKMEHIFDSTPLEAIQQGASKLQENIAPIWTRWVTFAPSNQIINLMQQQDVGITEEQLRAILEEQAIVVFDYINRSNFATQFFEHALDLLVGTGTMRVDEEDDDNMPLVFNAIPQKGLAFEEGPYGNIETHWRRFKVKARNLERHWRGFKPSQKCADMIKNAPNEEVEIAEGVVYIPKTKTYYGCVWLKDEDYISWMEDYGTSSPWVTGRYSKVSGEVRGRGPALQALPDAKSLNKTKEFVLQKAAIDLAGMYTATDDGVTNPYNISISPGIVIPVGSNNSANPSIQRLDTGANLSLVEFEITELQMAIKRALFNDLRDPAGPVRSATEVAIESRELAKRIGSAFGRLQTEVLIPIIKRVVYILSRRGLITPIQLNGRDVEIKFLSPLAKAQDGEDLLSVQQAVSFVMQTAGAEQSALAFKTENFGTWAAQKTGMPSELVRSEMEKQEYIQAAAQAMEAGMQPSAQNEGPQMQMQ